MKIIDLHQDLLPHVRFADQLGQQKQTGFEDIQSSDLDLVVATAFPTPENDNFTDPVCNQMIEEELNMYQEYCKQNSNWSVVKTVSDLDHKDQKLLLHVEGVNIFEDTPQYWDMLDSWYEIGLRSIGTHWNINNPLGGGTLDPERGLTDLGKKVILYLEEHDMLFDMAHMSRASFWDAAELVTRPLYVSHGNADALCQNVRNYTDEQLYAIAESGGVIGVFFPNTFVVGKEKQGTVCDVVNHIDYIVNLIGINHVAIGSDLGGIVSGEVIGMGDLGAFDVLRNEMQSRGYSEEDMEKVLHVNARRIIENHLGGKK